MTPVLALAVALVPCRAESAGDTLTGEQLASAYREAYRQAKRGEPKGYLKLYEIAAAGVSAEISESARDALHHFLYREPKLWVKTLSAVDFAKLERYLTRGGMAVIDLPPGVKTHKEYEAAIVAKLKEIKGDERETRLVKFILDYYQEHPSGDD